MIATGFIYTSYATWQTGCAGQIGCAGTVTNVIQTTNPLFYIMTGNVSGLVYAFGEMLSGGSTSTWTLWIPSSAGSSWSVVTIPSLAYPSITTGYPTTIWAAGYINIPWVQFIWVTWTGSLFGQPVSVSAPWLQAIAYTLIIPAVSIPFAFYVAYTGAWTPTIPWLNISWNAVTIPAISLTPAFFTSLLGIILLLVGFGVGIKGMSSGIEVSSQGAKLCQVIGIGILLWNFVVLFTGTWLYSLDMTGAPIGTILISVLQLIFVVGLYAQTQSSV